ncbi:unnamed protein product [Cochlearia groenlandica]
MTEYLVDVKTQEASKMVKLAELQWQQQKQGAFFNQPGISKRRYGGGDVGQKKKKDAKGCSNGSTKDKKQKTV